jgi:LemA protein
VLEEVTASRATALAADNVHGQVAAAQTLKAALGRLMAVAEAYPQLKANENFRNLQDQLAEIEDQLQMARRYYNGTVRDLNIAIETFPNSLIARPLGFHEEPFFELNDRADAAAPKFALS